MDPSTQSFLKIKEIKDDVLILDNGDLRGILAVSSVNFALKSNENQAAIIGAFQSFLNSLDFFCQIVVQSRNLNISPYLETIKALEEGETNELLKTQISSYHEFIKDLVKEEHITTKSFYVIVPYRPTENLGGNPSITQSILPGVFKGKSQSAKDEQFERSKNQLWQRMEFAAAGLRRSGLDVMPLTTPEIIDLFWKVHHPSEAEAGYSPEIAPELLS